MFVSVMLILILACILSYAASLELSDVSEKTDFIITKADVSVIAQDLHRPGKILFIDKCSVCSTDGVSIQTMAGSANNCTFAENDNQEARFQVMHGFVQRNASQLIVADTGNHCLRLVDRISNLTTGFVGTCQSRGNRNGSDALLNSPRSIIPNLIDPDQIIICDGGNSALRIVNRNLSVFTLAELDIANNPRRMVQIENGNLYISVDYGIVEFDYCRKTFMFIAGSTRTGFSDSPPRQALFGVLSDIVLLAPDKLLVADFWNYRLRLINLESNVTWSICTGGHGSRKGNLTHCWMNNPRALTIINDTIYIGEPRRISIIRGSLLITVKPTTGTTAASQTSASLTTTEIPTSPTTTALQQKDIVIYVGLCILIIMAAANLVMSCKRSQSNYRDEISATENGDTGTAVQMSQLTKRDVGTSEADPQYECPADQQTHPYGDKSNSHVYTNLEG